MKSRHRLVRPGSVPTFSPRASRAASCTPLPFAVPPSHFSLSRYSGASRCGSRASSVLKCSNAAVTSLRNAPAPGTAIRYSVVPVPPPAGHGEPAPPLPVACSRAPPCPPTAPTVPDGALATVASDSSVVLSSGREKMPSAAARPCTALVRNPARNSFSTCATQSPESGPATTVAAPGRSLSIAA
ncbi:hypothetical protein ACKVWC_011564 [Pyricularia oryzae]